MWSIFLILVEIWLFTQIVLNITKIWDYIEMLRTSKKTANIINNQLEETLKGVKEDGI